VSDQTISDHTTSDGKTPEQSPEKAFAAAAERIQRIAGELRQIAGTLEAGALSGGVGDTLPDHLRDRTMHITMQVANKLAELANGGLNRFTVPYEPDGTLAGTFAAFAPFLPPALISDAARNRISSALKPFPADVSRSFLLETRLGKPSEKGSDQVDLSVLIDPQLDGGREWLATNTDRSVPEWAQIAAFCSAWVLQPLQIDSAWLEFDLDAERGEDAPVPSLFFRTSDALQDDPEKARAALIPALNALYEGGIPDALQDPINKALDSLPEGSRVAWAGVMLSRDAADVGLRLCIDIPHDQIVPYVRSHGWQGSEEELGLLVKALRMFADVTITAFDLTPQGIAPLIGFETRYIKHRQPETEQRWSKLLDLLVRMGLCTPEKASAFMSWNGIFHEHTAQTTPQMFTRQLSHIKLQYQTATILRAKGYLSCIHRDAKLDKFKG
jgi:hypothetical protein